MLFYTDAGSDFEITDKSCQWDPRAWWDMCLICVPKEGVVRKKIVICIYLFFYGNLQPCNTFIPLQDFSHQFIFFVLIL